MKHFLKPLFIIMLSSMILKGMENIDSSMEILKEYCRRSQEEVTEGHQRELQNILKGTGALCKLHASIKSSHHPLQNLIVRNNDETYVLQHEASSARIKEMIENIKAFARDYPDPEKGMYSIDIASVLRATGIMQEIENLRNELAEERKKNSTLESKSWGLELELDKYKNSWVGKWFK